MMQQDDGLSLAGSLVFHTVVLSLALALPPAMTLSRDDLNRLHRVPDRRPRVLVAVAMNAAEAPRRDELAHGGISDRAPETSARGLPKAVIRRVIRRHINEWRECYQRELQVSPNLPSRVMLRFTIGPTGQVLASESVEPTVGNVDRCLARAVRRWRFPRPRGGGMVVVNYPVSVKSAG